MLSHYEGCTSREVSAMTGLNESTVRVHLFRAIRKLRGAVDGGRNTSGSFLIRILDDDATAPHIWTTRPGRIGRPRESESRAAESASPGVRRLPGALRVVRRLARRRADRRARRGGRGLPRRAPGDSSRRRSSGAWRRSSIRARHCLPEVRAAASRCSPAPPALDRRGGRGRPDRRRRPRADARFPAHPGSPVELVQRRRRRRPSRPAPQPVSHGRRRRDLLDEPSHDLAGARADSLQYLNAITPARGTTTRARRIATDCHNYQHCPDYVAGHA